MKKVYERVVYKVTQKVKASPRFTRMYLKMLERGYKVIVDRNEYVVFEKEATGNGWHVRELGHR